eukprot:scaffold111622_cov33-Tisochrysis_lutea.AAC.2
MALPDGLREAMPAGQRRACEEARLHGAVAPSSPSQSIPARCQRTKWPRRWGTRRSAWRQPSRAQRTPGAWRRSQSHS